MELATQDLAALGAGDLIRVSAAIPRAAPRTFALLTACLVFPLSFAVLAHTLFTHPILRRLRTSDYSAGAAQWLALFGYQFLYAIFLFTFSLLSTAAAVFTVASLYAAKPASTASSLAALPTILPRLLRTFLWVSLIMFAYHLVFVVTFVTLILVFVPNPSDASSPPPSPSFLLFLILLILVFLAVHVYISALWHLASVVSVLEPICGLAAMSKSRQLLQGRTHTAAVLVVSYFAACGVTAVLFLAAVVRGRDEEGSLGLTLPGKILVGAVLVSVLVVVNLLGLLVQSVFYYACKAFHNQQIDRTQLYEHLGGYLGEYVPLKSNVQMENL